MWSCAQISWYFEIGRTYLEKPRYESVDKLIEPTPEQLAKIFLEIDEDDSPDAGVLEDFTGREPVAAAEDEHMTCAVRG